MRRGQGLVVADDVACDGEVADVDLDLAGDEEARTRRMPILCRYCAIWRGVGRRGGLGAGLLRGAFDEAVREGEAAGEGEGVARMEMAVRLLTAMAAVGYCSVGDWRREGSEEREGRGKEAGHLALTGEKQGMKCE